MNLYRDLSKKIRVWDSSVGKFEELAAKQLQDVASLPVVEGVRAMPDSHWGLGACVGSVIALKKAVIPAAVGVDIGCGMLACKTSLNSHHLPENLKSLRAKIETHVPHGKTLAKKKSRDHGAWDSQKIPDHVEKQKKKIEGWFDRYRLDCGGISKWLNRRHPITHLGTLGTGNHFIELCLDEKDHVWIMLHSGSRGIGNSVGTHFINKAKEEMGDRLGALPNKDCAYLTNNQKTFKDYCRAVSICQQYAQLNREMMLTSVVEQMGRAFKNFSLTESVIDCHHNYIDFHYAKDLIITRKGAVSAKKGEWGIIPGSMGTKSYIVKGLGNNASYCSCSHGAGRIMSRRKAKERISLEEHISDTAGVECKKDLSVIDESPRAYKDIDAVMESQKDLVEIQHTLKQILCVKG